MPQSKSVTRGSQTRRPVGWDLETGAVLFHRDKPVAIDRLRALARDVVRSSSLICRVAAGDRCAALALHLGFWPFVREFEIAIDRHQLPRKPLRERYPDRFKSVFPKMAAAVREMRREEGSHAEHWHDGAQDLGIADLAAPVPPLVNALIAKSYTKLLPEFFSVLAGTELIAEELSEFLVASPRFTKQFKQGRWSWGDIHLLPHEHGPSHLEIDVDFARAYSPDGDIRMIERVVVDTIELFDRASGEVEQAMIA